MFLYALPIFLGAFLLFLIQPMIGRYILPWFGGVPAVWNTCMLFFQVLLLGGYAYSHSVVSILRPRRQLLVHCILLGACLLSLPVIPADSWKPLGSECPWTRIIILLAVTIGAPYLVLSTTGPLLQAWFARQYPKRSPYRLYSLSNLASMLALISYPFAIEPYLSLRWQVYLWSALFVVYCISCARCAWAAAHVAMPPERQGIKPRRKPAERRPGATDRLMWVALACCPCVMLLATNNQMSQDLPAVPFVWILPLCLYLLSFILCFDNPRWSSRAMWLALAVPAAAGAYLLLRRGPFLSLPLQVGLFSAALFVCCMICHGELARIKPSPAYLTEFYLWVSAGGAAGSALVCLVAPEVFSGYWEYPLGLLACAILVVIQLFRRAQHVRPWAAMVAGAIIAAIACGVAYHITMSARSAVARSRNFFGALSVVRKGAVGEPLCSLRLVNGRILHGEQFPDPAYRRLPTAYYGPSSGVGAAYRALRLQPDGKAHSLRIGVVGLGAGVMAAYGQPGDYIRFYEINPDVVRLCDRYFTFRKDCPATCEVVMGDARLTMERQKRQGQSGQFDLLVLDAFSGDSIPLHLLTREAFDIYSYHLKPGGIIAVHISNCYVDLAPVIRGEADACAKHICLIEDLVQRRGTEPSHWVLMSSDGALLNHDRLAAKPTPWPPDRPATLFTDDYCSLRQLVFLDF